MFTVTLLGAIRHTYKVVAASKLEAVQLARRQYDSVYRGLTTVGSVTAS